MVYKTVPRHGDRQCADQTAKGLKFGQCIPIMTWIIDKEGFFEIRTLNGGKGLQNMFSKFFKIS